ncbi:hypothetical protein, partial [Streptococcus pneumoniae]|uniref:hypothetical protein n=1 Tax=Streptococcus pneumoniae TaxID=1313 RepID=UPI0016622B90
RDLRLRLLAFGAPSERCLPENIEIVSTRIPSRALARDGERRDLRLRLLAFGAPSERCLPENIEIVSTRIPSR